MGLSNELARTLPKIPHPFQRGVRSALELESERMAATFGGVARETAPRTDVIAAVEAMLGVDGSGLSQFNRPEIKIVPYILWGKASRWRDDAGFVHRFLARVDAVWPKGRRRLWRHYVVNFDAESPATALVAAWLTRQVELLPEPIRVFTQEYTLLQTDRAPSALAVAALDSDRLVRALADVGLRLDMLRSSALLVSVLGEAGRLAAETSGMRKVPGKLTALVGGQVRNVLAEAVCSPALRTRSLCALVEGLVAWQEHQGQSESPEAVISFLVELNGDPRFAPTRWHGHVSDHARIALESWLSRETLESFFRIIDAMKTERQDMWRERRAFWLAYIPYVSKAWLVVGRNAVPIAEKRKLPFGRFSGGAANDHCGLMLEIRGTIMMEMNKTGSAFFWNASDPGLPIPFASTCNRQILINRKYERSESRTNHLPVDGIRPLRAIGHHIDWQQRFRDEIMMRTGLDVPLHS